MKSVIVFIAFFAIFIHRSECRRISRFQSNSDCSEEALRPCTDQLMQFSRDDVKVPENEKEVLDSCNVIRNGTKCIRKYISDCSPSVIRQMGKMAMGGVSRSINKRCSQEGIEAFLQHRDCIVNVKTPARNCYNGMVRNMYRVKAAKIDSMEIHQSVCCFISKMHDCNTDAVRNYCKEESQEYYGQETAKIMDEMMDLICPQNLRWGQPDCLKIDKSLPSNPDTPDDNNLSILPLVIDLMKKLAEDNIN